MVDENEQTITNADLLKLLNNLISSNEEIKKQNSEIKNEILNLKKEYNKEIDNLKSENSYLKTELNNIKIRTLKNERKSKKYNVIVYGIKENNGSDELEDINTILELINTKLDIDCKFHDIRDLYRIGNSNQNLKNPRPLLVEFIHYKLLQNILENQAYLKSSGISISKDYTPEDYQDRKLLHKYLKLARLNHQEAHIKKNQLYVNNKQFTAEGLRNLTEDVFATEIAKTSTKPKIQEAPNTVEAPIKRVTRLASQNSQQH